MANAKKCDRCGKYYDKNREYVNSHNGIKATLAGVCFIDTLDRAVEDRDLCDDCLSDFKLFMTNARYEKVE